MADIEDFLVASDNAKMKVLFVVLDSCFGSVNAECAIYPQSLGYFWLIPLALNSRFCSRFGTAPWIADGRYKNMSWMPNPGPKIVDAGVGAWGDLEK